MHDCCAYGSWDSFLVIVCLMCMNVDEAVI